MHKCPICLLDVPRLKTDSHTIARFLILQTKTKGENVAFAQSEINERNFRDIKGTIVCADCETRFTGDDNFAKAFFDEDRFSGKTTLITFPNGTELGVQEYDSNSFIPLKKYFLSTLLRHHLYLLKYEKSNLLGEHFEPMRSQYFSAAITANSYPVSMVHYSDFFMVGYPTQQAMDSVESIFFHIKQFRITVYVNSGHRINSESKEFVLSPSRVVALIMPIKGSKAYLDLKGRVREHQARPRKKPK